ncbi:MAG: adenylate/guanylate cyclase domain-containing protein [Thermodesulfobacteriota bacterium]
MSLRLYLVLSYAALIFLTLGLSEVMDTIVFKIAGRHQVIVLEALEGLTCANSQVSEEFLTVYAEKMVEAKAEEVAKEIAYLLGGRKTYDYEQLRRDQQLRALATQDILTGEGVAGYLDLNDNTGTNILHPNPQVEGKNFAAWKDRFPEMWNLVALSFKNPKVKGYYTFLDRRNQPRKKFMVLVQVPRTPFIVVAAVNIDEFFLPAQEKMKKLCQEKTVQTQKSLEASGDAIMLQIKHISIIGAVIFTIIAGVSGLFFAGAFSRPILRLRDGVKRMGEGDLTVTVPETGVKELVQLSRSFNLLGRQLTDYIDKHDFVRDTFGRYVTREVVKKLLEDKGALELGGETREVSLIMSDLRGFTALTADMAPSQIIAFLNRYLSKMIEILLDHHAVIDEIMGDGILAFFGAPEPLEDHPARAVACALAMQGAMEEINALNAAESLPHLEMGIAVNTGTVVVGNIGSERRTKYSVVGADVNFAARIESYAVGGQVLIGPATHWRVKELIEVGEVIRAEMKGVPEPATLYEVRAIHGPYNLRLQERRETLIPLAATLPVHIYRIKNKIITSSAGSARITHLSETGAVLQFAGELTAWEDVRLHLLNEQEQEIPGKVYGKVTAVEPGEGDLQEAHIHFTSVSPKSREVISAVLGEG